MSRTTSREISSTTAIALPADANGRLFAALAAANEAVVSATTREALQARVCEAALQGGEFLSAAIWVVAPDGRLLQLAAVAGRSEHLARLRISTDSAAPAGRGPTGVAFATRRSVISNDIAADPSCEPWRSLIDHHGIAAIAAVPLLSEGRSFAVLQLMSAKKNAFDEMTVMLLERMAEGIAFAVGKLELQQRHRLAEWQLGHFRATLDIAVDALYLTDRRTMRFLDANQTACERTGYTREELLQRGPRDMIDSTHVQLEAHFDEVIARWPDVVVSEEAARDRHGKPLHVELHRRAVRSGDDWLIVTSSRDITGRRRDQSLLRLEHAVTCLLAEAHSLRRTLGMVSRMFCESEGWLSGGYFRAESADGASRLIAGWDQPAQDGMTREANQQLFESLQPPGGTISVTILERRPLWVPDITAASGAWTHSRHHLERLQHTTDRSRFNFPVMVGGVAIGAMSFTTNQTREPDERLLLSVRVIGDQIGQFVRRKQAEQTLRASEARFRGLTELSSDWYWEQDAEHRFTMIGGGRHDSDAERVRRDLSLGRRLWELDAIVPESADFEALKATVQRHEKYRDFELAVRGPEGPTRHLSISGEPVHDERGRFVGYRGVTRDVTERRAAEERIQHLANHDALTGLPNRAMFGDVLTRAIDYARRYNGRFAVLFIDLDRFKVINDTLGHDAGDELLKDVARRFRDCVRASDVFARLGGDEFVVLLQNIEDEAEIGLVANKILGATARPVFVRGQECRVTASLGICRFPLDAEDEQSLMKGADIAMYRAKQDGKNNFRFHSPDIRTRSLERLQMETHLRRALDRGEFSLHYQPKVDLAHGEVIGVEALLRWDSPELGSVAPADFIGLAEETGLIVSIGKWVLRTACLQNMAWQRDGLPAVSMAVNLSARQFADADLLDDLANVLCESGMAAGLLNLEITESMVAHDAVGAVKLLQAIRETGVKLSIDDFGTGYSSLAQLKRFPLDALKIDRSFIRDIPGDAEDMAIAQAIIAMGKTLQLTIVAEGVETEAQEAFLRENRCDQMQGYHFSRPLPADALAALWREHLALTAEP